VGRKGDQGIQGIAGTDSTVPGPKESKEILALIQLFLVHKVFKEMLALIQLFRSTGIQGILLR
jgi:hypothetical protein